MLPHVDIFHIVVFFKNHADHVNTGYLVNKDLNLSISISIYTYNNYHWVKIMSFVTPPKRQARSERKWYHWIELAFLLLVGGVSRPESRNVPKKRLYITYTSQKSRGLHEKINVVHKAATSHTAEVWVVSELQVNFFPRAPMTKSYKIRPILLFMRHLKSKKIWSQGTFFKFLGSPFPEEACQDFPDGCFWVSCIP